MCLRILLCNRILENEREERLMMLFECCYLPRMLGFEKQVAEYRNKEF